MTSLLPEVTSLFDEQTVDQVSHLFVGDADFADWFNIIVRSAANYNSVPAVLFIQHHQRHL